jgi:hypothetical protein
MRRTPEQIAEHWQREALQQQHRKYAYKADLIRAEANLRIWKYGAIAMTVVALTLAVSLAFSGQRTATREKRDSLEWIAVPRVSPSSEKWAPTPPHILASVHVGGCSGTVVSKGETGAVVVSAFHCVGHRVGQTYKLHHPDGTEVNALLVDVDSSHDLAKFKIPAEGVLGIAQVPEAMPASDEIGSYEVVGYPNGEGPKYFHLSQPRDNNLSSIPGLWRWTFNVEGGNIYGGNSGCGVFVNGKLCGVLSHRDETNNGKTLYCCPHEHLVSFCKKRFRDDDGCGNGICPVPKRDEAPPAPAPTPKKNPSGWTPKPNVPIVLPEVDPDDAVDKPKPYDGKGKQPGDLNSPRKKSIEIDKLRKSPPPIEHAPDAPELPAPAPPAIDAALHGKVDALGKTLGDVQSILSRPQPDLSTVHGKLDALKNGIQDLGTVKGDVADLKSGMGSLPVPLDAEKTAAAIKSGLSSLPIPLDAEKTAAAVEAAAPGVASKVVAALPGLLGPVGIPVSAALLGSGGLFGLFHLLAARKQSKSSQQVSASLDSHSQTVGGQTVLLSSLTDVVKSLVKPVAQVAANGAASSAPAEIENPPPPPAAPNPLLQEILSAVKSLSPSPQPSPAQAGATSAPAPQAVLDTTVTQVMNDAWRTAYSQAKQDLARKEGIPSMNTIALFESLLNQRLGGLQIKPVKS